MIWACRAASTLPATSLNTVRKATPCPTPAVMLARISSHGLLQAAAAAISRTETPRTARPADTANRPRMASSWLRAEDPSVSPASRPISGRESAWTIWAK
ncbi:hypothetical protein NicSoilC12_06560 [Arthrobacter sp. NicSoilC12]|nr:hypothetical protein NicSoilC12_06560 [Arthrobacter sp. NicSoilC12]